MKFIGALFLTFSLGQSWALEKLTTELESKSIMQERNFENLKSQNQYLAEIKYFILNGETKHAKRELLKIDSNSPVGMIIKDRYLALLHFIEGEHETSLKILQNDIFLSDNGFSKICMLKIMNLLILNKSQTLEKEFKRCKNLNSQYAENFDWMQALIDLKLKKKELVNGKKIAFEIEFNNDISSLKTWLKLSLYLNKEELVLPLISQIPLEAYEDKEVRELVGLIYYRKKKFKSSVNFIEDLSTPNSENIKGNIYLEKKNYELAYGQFKLALTKKQNSYNAIERALSLAWILNQWDDGYELSKKTILNDRNEPQRLTLQAAFLTNLKRYDDAAKELERAQSFFGTKLPKELSQLYAYVSIMREDRHTLKRYLNSACDENDGLSCWLILTNHIWEDFSKTIKREDEINLGQEITLQTLKTKADPDSLIEGRKIDQRDIEELDEQAASLIKKTNKN
jgi:hypothetical protein